MRGTAYTWKDLFNFRAISVFMGILRARANSKRATDQNKKDDAKREKNHVSSDQFSWEISA